MRRALAVCAVLAIGGAAHARYRYADDGIDRPTDTHVTLVPGLWHDDAIAPGAGWHLYHFTADADGPIAFQMRAEVHGQLWSYLRIVDAANHEQSWASVANRRTNLCEVIVEVERGHAYDVIATSQQNAVLERGQPQTVRGTYTIAALPIDLRAAPEPRAPAPAPPAPPAAPLPYDPALAQPDDLAILYPLAAATLSPATPGRGGELLPAPLYARAFGEPGALQLGGTPAVPGLASLRVVAIRLDPCFARTAATAAAPCRPQLRLVFQPVTAPRRGAPTAADAAVHAFYSLDGAQLADAVRALVALRRATAGDRDLGPLAPHPLLAAADTRGPFAASLAALVQSLAGPDNLVRLTAVTSSGLGAAWNFTGADLADGRATPLAIPGLAAPGALVAFFAGFAPGPPPGDAAFAPALAPAPDDDLRRADRAFAAAHRIEDPMLHSAETIDCASCHVANAVRAGGAVNVHMFGYKGTAASIQPRTVNEVAASVALVNARVLTR